MKRLLDALRRRLGDRTTLAERMDFARALAEAGDHEGALAIWQPLAQAGVARAQNNIGACFIHGRGVPADPGLALRWLTLAAEGGDRVGQRNLATLHFEGLGVERDYATAAGWFRCAAEAGDGEAQDMLSFMLLDGEMLPQEPVEARRWAEAAAIKGYAGAATRLGTVLYNALGCERDAPGAVRWWRQASSAGDGDASAMLGAALHLGQGTPADQDEAYCELTLAERRGSLLASRFLPSVRDRLTPKAAQEAERRAEERFAEGRLTADARPAQAQVSQEMA